MMAVIFRTPVLFSIPIGEGVQYMLDAPLILFAIGEVGKILLLRYLKPPFYFRFQLERWFKVLMQRYIEPHLFSLPNGEGIQNIMAAIYLSPSDFHCF